MYLSFGRNFLTFSKQPSSIFFQIASITIDKLYHKYLLRSQYIYTYATYVNKAVYFRISIIQKTYDEW